MSYLGNVLVAVNVATNVLFGGLPDETISARVCRVANAHTGEPWYRQPGVYIANRLNTLLNWIQRQHGRLAEEGDLARALAVAAAEDHALGLPPPPPENDA